MSLKPAPDEQAVQVARLYYHQGLTTGAIARELGLSRPKVSRLLTLARRSGLVEIRIHDPREHPQRLEDALRGRFPFLQPQVVGVPPGSDEGLWLERVAVAAARLLSASLRPGQTVGLAWGNTLDAVSRALTPGQLAGVEFVQLNGSATAFDLVNGFVSDTVLRFARNYGARAWLFPVPAFFDSPDTKRAMWGEASVRHVVDIQRRADVLLYSVGSRQAHTPSHVYMGGYLGAADLGALDADRVVGDIATVFYRRDGSFRDVALNARASGPDLSLFQQAPRRLCVVSGLGKVPALLAALRGGFMSDLVVDEATARALLEQAGD